MSSWGTSCESWIGPERSGSLRTGAQYVAMRRARVNRACATTGTPLHFCNAVTSAIRVFGASYDRAV